MRRDRGAMCSSRPVASPTPICRSLSRRSSREAGEHLRVWFVTDYAQSVGRETPNATGAAIWGACRVVAEEYPDWRLTLVDMPSLAPVDVATLVQKVLVQEAETQIAIRDGGIHVLRLTSTSLPSAAPVAWRKDATYLVTGGLGDIGLRIARSMIEQGARHLVLLGRTALPPRAAWLAEGHSESVARRIDAVREMESLGAHIRLAAIDVSDEASLATWLASHRAEGRPAIRGVVHAAGSFANRLARDMDRASFASVVDAKLGGARSLDALLPELDLFVCFASSGAFMPQPGQANYAAANAGLDAVARARRARGQPAVSIAWGVWEGTGLVADAAGKSNVTEMERQGYLSLPPDRACALFARLAVSTEDMPAVIRMDWSRYAAARAGRHLALFADMTTATTGRHADAPRADGVGIAPLAQTEEIVRRAVGRVLKMAPDRIDPRKTFGSMGLTSLVAMELRNRLESDLGRPLSATLAWNFPTVESLAKHLANSAEAAAPAPVRETMRAADEPPASRDLESALTDIDALSDDESFALLIGARSARPRR